ncbi:hypothetical protein FHS66_001856 [Pacificitalea manganoxidans]|nr:hypothetical protein [Pacificitalea manganoxidans]
MQETGASSKSDGAVACDPNTPRAGSGTEDEVGSETAVG